MQYLNSEDVLLIHDIILQNYGWLAWIKDLQQIKSILQHIQNDEYYNSIIEKSVHLFFWMIQFHCFNDGNKRTSITTLHIFWLINDIKIENIYVKLEDIAVWVAKWEITKNELRVILKSLILSFWYKI